MAIGFETVPVIGDSFASWQAWKRRIIPLTTEQRLIKKNAAEKFRAATKEGQKTINIVLKADVLGSLEVLKETIGQIPQTEITLDILNTGAGEINLNDVKMARSSHAVIVGFRVKTNPTPK